VTPMERTLRTLESQVQFRLALCVAELAAAVDRVRASQNDAEAASVARERSASALRATLNRETANPPLVEAIRSIYRAEAATALICDAQLESDRCIERLSRMELQELRRQEEALRQCLRSERLAQSWRIAAEEGKVLDDLCLQRFLRRQ